MAVAERSIRVSAEPKSTRPRDAAPAHAGLQHSAMRLLDVIDRRGPADDRAWFGQVAVAVRRVRWDLAAHVRAAEARDGIHAEISRAEPRLVSQTQRLAEEHRSMKGQIDLLDRLAASRTLMSRGGVEEAMRTRAIELLELVRRHRQRDSDVVHEAYVAELGASG